MLEVVVRDQGRAEAGLRAKVARWEGVEEVDGGRAVRLGWNGKGLKGSIPAHVLELYGLRDLSLDDNQISGVSPPEICKLLSLDSLSLRQNRLEHRLPLELRELASLEFLDLSENNFSGVIAFTLANLTYLEILYLEVNKFTDALPDFLLENKQWIKTFLATLQPTNQNQN